MSLVTVESEIGTGIPWRNREEALAQHHGELLPARSFTVGEVVEFLTSDRWERARVEAVIGTTDFGPALAGVTGAPYNPTPMPLEEIYACMTIRDSATGQLRGLTRAEMEARHAAAQQVAWVSVVFLRDDGSDWRYEDGSFRTGMAQEVRRVPAPVASPEAMRTIWRADGVGIGGVYIGGVYAEGTHDLRAFHNQAERFLVGRVPGALRVNSVVEHVSVRLRRAKPGSPVEHVLVEVPPTTRGAKAITLYRLPGWTLSP